MARGPGNADMAQGPQSGFGVVEAMIALAIIAAALAMMFDAMVTDIRRVRSVDLQRHAMLVARSVLDGVIAGDSRDEGRDGPLHWRVEHRPYGDGGLDDAAPLEQVTVVVIADGGGRPLASLATLRIRP